MFQVALAEVDAASDSLLAGFISGWSCPATRCGAGQ
jgi:hypothetical protein